MLKVLKDYTTDLTQCDRTVLSKYTGAFLLSYRPTGTNILLLEGVENFAIESDKYTIAEQVARIWDNKRYEVAMETQTHWLHFTGRKFEQLTREQALALVDRLQAGMMATLPARLPRRELKAFQL